MRDLILNRKSPGDNVWSGLLLFTLKFEIIVKIDSKQINTQSRHKVDIEIGKMHLLCVLSPREFICVNEQNEQS